jgi:hypothetical protein
MSARNLSIHKNYNMFPIKFAEKRLPVPNKIKSKLFYTQYQVFDQEKGKTTYLISCFWAGISDPEKYSFLSSS